MHSATPAPRVDPARPLMTSEEVEATVVGYLLDGTCDDPLDAGERFVLEHLDRIVDLIDRLSPEENARHEALRLLMFHGSPPAEDDLL